MNRFHEYQQSSTLTLLVPRWLVCTGDSGKVTYASIYRAEPQVVPRKTLINVSVYETYFMSSLLYDREERNALQMQQYGYTRQYPARVQELTDGQCSLDNQIQGDSVALGGQKLIPHVGNEITVFVVGLSDPLDKETELKRRVFDIVMDGYDFKTVVPGAGGIGKAAMHRLCRFETVNGNVIWQHQDLDNARKAPAVTEACNLIKTQQSPVVLSHCGDEAGGKFSWRNILLDQESDIWASDLFDYLTDNYRSDSVLCEEAQAAAASMPNVCSLNEEQKTSTPRWMARTRTPSFLKESPGAARPPVSLHS